MSISSSGRSIGAMIAGANWLRQGVGERSERRRSHVQFAAELRDWSSSRSAGCRKRSCVRRRKPPVPLFRSRPNSYDPILGILLALACALATNVGFLFKHRGACAAPAVDIRHPLRSAKALFASQAVRDRHADRPGAWIFHVAAMSWPRCRSSRPSSPAAWCCSPSWPSAPSASSIARKQWVGIILTAVGLLLLGFSLPATHGAHSHYSAPAMIGFEGVLLAAGTLLIMGPRIGAPEEHHGFMLGAAAGILFGVSDVAIKAHLRPRRRPRRPRPAEPLDCRHHRRLRGRLLRLGQGPAGRRRRPGHRRHRHRRQRLRHRRWDPRLRRPALDPPADVRRRDVRLRAWSCSPPG